MDERRLDGVNVAWADRRKENPRCGSLMVADAECARLQAGFVSKRKARTVGAGLRATQDIAHQGGGAAVMVRFVGGTNGGCGVRLRRAVVRFDGAVTACWWGPATWRALGGVCGRRFSH